MAEQLLEIVSDLALRAGEVTLKYFQKGVKVESKKDESPVTIADRETEQFLREEILRRFPGDSVVGEEFGESKGNVGGRKWIIDPIDGTKSFIHGVPLYGVMIGIEEEGRIVAGAVNIPALGEMVSAERGRGCWWNGNKAKVSEVDNLADAVLLTTDYKNNYRYNRGEAWEKVSAAAKFVRTWGDCYGHILVATGRAEVMMDPQMNPWDNAPLQVVLEEAGGTFTDYQGTPTIYGDCAISTNGKLFEKVMALVK